MSHIKVDGWDCRDGMPDEDHDWGIVWGDSSVGEGDFMECCQCGKTRDATCDDVQDAYAGIAQMEMDEAMYLDGPQ